VSSFESKILAAVLRSSDYVVFDEFRSHLPLAPDT
jgi:hypothetical protein